MIGSTEARQQSSRSLDATSVMKGAIHSDRNDTSSAFGSATLTCEDQALVELVRALRDCNYHFATVTPLTQARVNARANNTRATDLAGVFGWSRSFSDCLLPPQLIGLMRAAKVIAPHDGGGWRSLVRVSTIGTQLFVHSSYPTMDADSVFFGPDTVRFVDAIRRHLTERAEPTQRVVDIGCGAGPGGIVVAAEVPDADVMLLDINATALRFARINAVVNGVAARVIQSNILQNAHGRFDLIVSNPPYLIDGKGRTYRHGGGRFGEGLALEILRHSMSRLAKGGMLLLYTGTAVVAGHDVFAAECRDILGARRVRCSYTEVDPDVFGEELETPTYADVDRIAAVVLAVTNLGE
jgi:methylase of polypeptide subunit release factors